MFEPGLIHILPSDREMMVSYKIPAASLSKLQPGTTILAVVSTAFNVRDVSIQLHIVQLAILYNWFITLSDSSYFIIFFTSLKV